ncbi:hypothetical protein TELCIR_17900 [Teladorsagia circumcincta]|uniref:Uncharacterized protein n=1 Tax=Teladorsagia circumcincta TaxID=45464 RepID=A0A2G9TTK8_TELCI|nr:hypothetical protein TELCIR_17900 [Teladorsagia circumcincta]
MERVSVCDSLLKRNKNEPFLKRMVTGDEKWIMYNNVEREQSWSHPGEPPQTTLKAKIQLRKITCAVLLMSDLPSYKGAVSPSLMSTSEESIHTSNYPTNRERRQQYTQSEIDELNSYPEDTFTRVLYNSHSSIISDLIVGFLKFSKCQNTNTEVNGKYSSGVDDFHEAYY